jgi:transposase
MTYSIDFRRKVLEVREAEKLSIKKISKRFDVGPATVLRWIKNLKPKVGRNKAPIKIGDEELKRDVDKYPDAYLYERAERLGASRTGIHSALKRLKITRGKKASRTPKPMKKSRNNSREG